MRVAVSAQSKGIESETSDVFGRCPFYVFTDLDTGNSESLENPAANAAGGAGVLAAQFVIEHGAEAVLTGEVGPNAMDVLAAAGIPAYRVSMGTVQQAVDSFRAGGLPLLTVGGVSRLGVAPAGGDGVADRAQGEAGAAETSELEGIARELRRRLVDISKKLDELERER